MTKILPFFVLGLSLVFGPLNGPAQQPDTLQHTVQAPAGVAQAGTLLGTSMAVHGNYVVAGVPSDDTGAADSGVVKVFDANLGTLLHLIPNPHPASGDNFGNAVAISGTRVVVGTSGDDQGAQNAGRVYVFNLSSATPTVPVVTLNNPAPALNDYYGNSVAIDGNRVVVGAYWSDVGAANAGRVYVYDVSTATPSVPIYSLGSPVPQADDNLGVSVAVSGTRVVVGVYRADNVMANVGLALVYNLAGPNPTVPAATLRNPTPASNDYFGYAVAISGTKVVVGADSDDIGATNAGSAYVYEVGPGAPALPSPIATLNNPSPTAMDGFGWAVAISGTRVVIGCPQDDTGANQAGCAYVYNIAGGTPTVPVATLNNPSPAVDDAFGTAVAASGIWVAVGTPSDDTAAVNAGSAYVYNYAVGAPTTPAVTIVSPGPAAADFFGYAVALSGTWLAASATDSDFGATNSGSVSVYDLGSGTPTTPVFTMNNPNPTVADRFGQVLLAQDHLLIVGTPCADVGGGTDVGTVYIYDLTSSTPTTPMLTLNGPTASGSDYFGSSMGISGNLLAVGNWGEDVTTANDGIVYIYDLSSATPDVPVFTLNNPSPAPGDAFGQDVAIDGMRVVVGVRMDDTGATDSGCVYVYDLASATPTVPVLTLNHPVPAATEYFGSSVAISGTNVAVAVYNFGPSNVGRVYVYDLTSGTPTTPAVTVANPTEYSGENFGTDLAMSGTRLLVGSSSDRVGLVGAGAAYVYDLSGATPSVPVAVLANPTPQEADAFGRGIAIHGTTVAIGAPQDDGALTDKGIAYVYAPADPDYDDDGLLDQWEYARFGSIATHTKDDDTDLDGRTELIELAFDSDPLVVDPPSTLPEIFVNNGYLTVVLTKRAGASYVVETAGIDDDAAYSAATTTIVTNTATTLRVRDNVIKSSTVPRYMRLKVSPAP